MERKGLWNNMEDVRFTLAPMNEAEARAVVAWKYSGEYAVYNFSDYETCKARGYEITIPTRRAKAYRSVYLNDKLFGFFHMMKRREHTELGVGICPEECGKHYGKTFVSLAVRETLRTFPGKPIWLKVRPFNTRAIRCYKSVGFVEVDRYYEDTFETPGEMINMVLCGGASLLKG